MLFRSLRHRTGRLANCPPACNQRLAVEMESPNIGGYEVANPVIPINSGLMLQQMMTANRANAPLLFQLVGQQELLPTPMKPPAHERKTYQGSVNNMLCGPATSDTTPELLRRSAASMRACAQCRPAPLSGPFGFAFGKAFVAWFDRPAIGGTAGNPLVISLCAMFDPTESLRIFRCHRHA